MSHRTQPARRFGTLRRRTTGRLGRGQSLVEFALVIPFLLLILLIAIDFGRVYLGWINLQQMTRVAANFAAEHASAWGTPEDAAVLAAYQELVENDAEEINCELQRNDDGDLPGPAFLDLNFALGNRVQVNIDCKFTILTPVIGNIIGDDESKLLIGANIVYPIREGAVAEVPGGGAPILVAPVAAFFGTPQSGYGPLQVTFVDESENEPSDWVWDFGNGTAFTEGPHVRTYECDPSVLPGDSCFFTVSLEVQNDADSDTATEIDYIEVVVPPDTGPIAEFTGNPLSGEAPLDVDFEFEDVRLGAVTYTEYAWDFTSNGSWDTTGATETSVSHTYPAPGIYSVTLRVTDDTGATHVHTKVAYVNASRPVCSVPDFAGVKVSNAQTLWAQAGFSTTVNTLPPPPKPPADYKIKTQSILGGTIDPDPDGCDSVITVGP